MKTVCGGRASLFVAIGFCVFLNVGESQAQKKCGSVEECAQAAVEAALRAQELVASFVPSGAIMAFRLEECPAGWKPVPELAGRVVVGAGVGQSDFLDRPLTERTLGEVGGEEIHELTVDEMPSHTHGYKTTDNGQLLDNDHNKVAQPRYGVVRKRNTASTGGDGGHNNMQPFLVLTYCERE